MLHLLFFKLPIIMAYLIMGYLMGSICSAIIVSRLFDLPDPRLEGSKNPGATNVLRLAGKQYALIVLLTDMIKGALPVIIAGLLGAGPTLLGFVAFAAVLGHMYPVFFGFKGGKGVATAIGALFGLHVILGVLVLFVWFIVARLTRYSSLASIVSIILAPFFSLFILGNPAAFAPLCFITIVVLYKHRGNITRLVDGQEPKINSKAKTPEELLEATEEILIKKMDASKKPKKIKKESPIEKKMPKKTAAKPVAKKPKKVVKK